MLRAVSLLLLAGLHLELLHSDSRPAQGVVVQHGIVHFELKGSVRDTTISVLLPTCPTASSAVNSNHCM